MAEVPHSKEINMKKKAQKILDRKVSVDNYCSFRGCEVTQNGKAIRFIIYDTIYEVPLKYLTQWFSMPHYIFRKGTIKVLTETEAYKGKAPSSIIKCRRVRKNSMIRVYFNNFTAVDVVWDTVLMACEKRYEHFGGLTKKSKEIIKRGFHLVRKRTIGGY